jgi:NAD(P)-dependent dehydrogenase (short-subunit alcohol dehydrogenase family)
MGQAWARQLANEGATVAILDVNSDGMADTASGFDSVHQV